VIAPIFRFFLLPLGTTRYSSIGKFFYFSNNFCNKNKAANQPLKTDEFKKVSSYIITSISVKGLNLFGGFVTFCDFLFKSAYT